MKIHFKHYNDFGTVNAVGVHQQVDEVRDVDNALYNAERDGFEAVYLYVYLPSAWALAYARHGLDCFNV